MNQEQQAVIEAIQEEGHNPNAIGQIEFDKETGQFKYNQEAPRTGSAQVILENSQDGFAAEATPSPLPPLSEIYSMGKGIFESGLLRAKRILTVGLGSVGSYVDEKFAREGVGRFILMDNDRVELRNISRHLGGIKDLSQLKTDVVEEAILQKNPYAEIVKYPVNVLKDREALAEAIRNADLVCCLTDNNPSRYAVASEAAKSGKTVIYGRAETRAEGVNIFIQRPGEACYNCLVDSGGMVEEEITDEASARANGTIPAYTSPEEADVMVQIGLPSDIDPLVTMIVKLGLLELTRGSENSGIAGLDEELREFNYFIWANRRTKRYLSFSPFNRRRDLPTILSWYGCTVPHKPHCTICR